jgi:hypothetical protein
MQGRENSKIFKGRGYMMKTEEWAESAILGQGQNSRLGHLSQSPCDRHGMSGIDTPSLLDCSLNNSSIQPKRSSVTIKNNEND